MMIPEPGLPPAASPPVELFDLIENLPHWQSSLLAHLDSVQTADRLKELFESGDNLQLCLISDGGTKDDLGSFGWDLAV